MKRAEFEKRAEIVQVAAETLMRHKEEGIEVLSSIKLTEYDKRLLWVLGTRSPYEREGRVSKDWEGRLLAIEESLRTLIHRNGRSLLDLLTYEPGWLTKAQFLNEAWKAKKWL